MEIVRGGPKLYTHTQTQIHTHTHRHTHTDRHTHRHTHTDRQTHTHTHGAPFYKSCFSAKCRNKTKNLKTYTNTGKSIKTN